VGLEDYVTRSPSEHSQAVAITDASTDSPVVRAPLGAHVVAKSGHLVKGRWTRDIDSVCFRTKQNASGRYRISPAQPYSLRQVYSRNSLWGTEKKLSGGGTSQ
jgi:hypothetical protein